MGTKMANKSNLFLKGDSVDRGRQDLIPGIRVTGGESLSQAFLAHLCCSAVPDLLSSQN